MKGLFCAAVFSAVAACTTSPVVYDPSDKPGQPPSGSIRPLRELVPQDGRHIRLVFVHGVGDHCSGYALDPDTGWLNDTTAGQIGLRATSLPTARKFINVNVFMGGARDERSGVEYSTRSFVLALGGVPKEIPVEAIEITWSPLTQWVKSNQLGYDSPSTTPAPGAKAKGCTQAPDTGIPLTKEPPSRLLLDRTIKELVFDRNLADAILYSGTYGATMERGVAEALCHAMTATAEDVRCAWPIELTTDKFFFVTHSLGSRVIYDVFLNLLGVAADDKSNPFSVDEIRNAAPAMTSILANTQAFYMMANQLSLLGLANVPKDARSSAVLHPYSLPLFELSRIEGVIKAPTPRNAQAPQAASPERPNFGNVLQAIAVARSLAISKTDADSARLQIVAFNDTNDLLTWHIPPWYANDGLRTNSGRPLVDITNVFVQNTAKLVIIESPGPAHTGYFTNNEVWTTISCGATSGHVATCP